MVDWLQIGRWKERQEYEEGVGKCYGEEYGSVMEEYGNVMEEYGKVRKNYGKVRKVL